MSIFVDFVDFNIVLACILSDKIMAKSTKSTKNCNILLQISNFSGSYSYHEDDPYSMITLVEGLEGSSLDVVQQQVHQLKQIRVQS